MKNNIQEDKTTFVALLCLIYKSKVNHSVEY